MMTVICLICGRYLAAMPQRGRPHLTHIETPAVQHDAVQQMVRMGEPLW